MGNCAGTRKGDMKKRHMVPKGENVMVIVHPDLWEPFVPTGKGEKPSGWDFADAVEKAKVTIGEMNEIQRMLFMDRSGKEQEKEHHKFLAKQKKLCKFIEDFQKEELDASGYLKKGTPARLVATPYGSLIRAAVITNTFSTSKGDVYSLKYIPDNRDKITTEVTTSDETTNATEGQAAEKELSEKEAKEKAEKQAKEKAEKLKDRAKPHETFEEEHGVPRARILFYQFFELTGTQLESLHKDMRAYPMPAQIWGKKYANAANVSVKIQDTPFQEDTLAPSAGNCCCRRKIMYHKYTVANPDEKGKDDVLYYYLDKEDTYE